MNDLMIVSVITMAGLAFFFATVLAIADKKLKVEEDPRVKEISALLPGVNCGACGCLSCQDFAEHIVKETVSPDKCKALAEEQREKLYTLLGKEGGTVCTVIPLVHCSAETEYKKPLAEYKGINTCRAANLVFGSGIECEYGCMGFGDCAEKCPFDALYMDKGLPMSRLEKCTACGKCQEACPRGIIKMQEKRNEKLFYVACCSHDDALMVRKICAVGCIACGICVKLSQEGFFKLEDNLSYAEYSKQNAPEKVKVIADKCPTKVIKET